MLDFQFLNSTKIIFGKGSECKIGEETAQYSKKVLLHYGGGSIKKSGLYDRVVKSLTNAGVAFVELGGVQPNPRLKLAQEGIELCRKENIDFIVAVGGGSVIDSAKAISIGVPYDGDVWDFYAKKAQPKEALGVCTVLTIPAAGSESSDSSVITNEANGHKRGLTSSIYIPKFSILNPELTYTLPNYQTACGITDMLAHVMERYFTNTTHVDLSDKLCEAVMKSIINNGPKVLEQNDNYDYRAEIMWNGTLAHNNLVGMGREGDWASHNIEHELSAMFDIAHGAGLAIVFPAWMKYVYKHDINRFAQFAVNVWGVEPCFGDLEQTALEGIYRLESFLKRIGMPIRLSQGNMPDVENKLETMASIATEDGSLGSFVPLKKEDIVNIYKLALNE